MVNEGREPDVFLTEIHYGRRLKVEPLTIVLTNAVKVIGDQVYVMPMVG